MGNFKQSQVFRSLGAAVLLQLSNVDPETDYDVWAALPVSQGRKYIQHDNQIMPMVAGPLQTLLVPGVVVESGRVADYRGKRDCPVVVSIGMNIEGSPDRQQAMLSELCDRLHPFIFTKKSCPIYKFADDSDTITGVAGFLDWHDERYNDPLPRETLVGVVANGGWYRNEYSFTVHYTMDEGDTSDLI